MRSKLNNHEFDLQPGAWDDMQKKLDKLEVPSSSRTLAPWLSLSAMIISVVAILYYYQNEMPYGKADKISETIKKTNEPKQITEQKSTIKKSNTSIVSADNSVNSDTKNEEKTTLTRRSASTHNRIIEAATFSQSIKADKPILTSLPQKFNPIPFNSDVISNNSSKIIENRFDNNKSSFDNSINPENFELNTRSINSADHLIIALEGKKAAPLKTMVDTPILALKTPHSIPVKKIKFGVSVGVNTKIYADNNYSIAPTAGIFIRRAFNGKYAIQADLQYKMLLKNRQNDHEQQRVMPMQLDVDPSAEILMENKTAEIYGIKSIHMIELPISFVYRLHKRHNVALGINTAMLMGVKTENRNINNLPKAELGFSSIDLGVLAAYEFNISKNISLSVSYNVGFLNLAKNTKVRQLEMNESIPSYRINNSDTEEACLMPVHINNQEQIFFEAPTNLYNTDAKILLRYNF